MYSNNRLSAQDHSPTTLISQACTTKIQIHRLTLETLSIWCPGWDWAATGSSRKVIERESSACMSGAGLQAWRRASKAAMESRREVKRNWKPTSFRPLFSQMLLSRSLEDWDDRTFNCANSIAKQRPARSESRSRGVWCLSRGSQNGTKILGQGTIGSILSSMIERGQGAALRRRWCHVRLSMLTPTGMHESSCSWYVWYS